MDNQYNDNIFTADQSSNLTLPRQHSDQELLETQYNSILDLVRELKENAIKHVEKRHLEKALAIILWPNNENVWAKAEAICMAKAKHILENMHSDDPAIAVGLKPCLQATLYLNETMYRSK